MGMEAAIYRSIQKNFEITITKGMQEVKLTEAKLKQMILEAFKSTYHMDFGIPTPDEKLRSELGDETYGKIQSLDKEQADIMKQSFDPNYPRDLKQETIQSFMESHGFDLEIQEVEPAYTGPLGGIFMNEVYIHSDSSRKGAFSIDYGIKTYDSLPNKKYIYFKYSYLLNYKATRKNGSIEIANMFDLDMGSYFNPNYEDIETMSSLIIRRIKNDLKKLIGTQ